VAFGIADTIVTVTYDVADLEQSSVTITMEVSSDNGATWSYNYNSPQIATGDIGTGITVSPVASHKTITWKYKGVYNNQFLIRIFANDETAGGSPCVGTPTVDYAGKTYNTIQIGDQCWLKENLVVGTLILATGNQTNNDTIEKFCYNANPDTCTKYGGLYQWGEAVQYKNGATDSTSPSPAFSGNIQGICPTGWHLPSNAEFQALATVVGNNGNALNAVGQNAGVGVGTNTSGFSALFAGFHPATGPLYQYLGVDVVFWTSTETNPTNAQFVDPAAYSSNAIIFSPDAKANGFSVRCLKD
jgi:uncharacterized protein (TIGR02145 family)